VKKVIPTTQAAKRFSQISKMMVSAVKNQDWNLMFYIIVLRRTCMDFASLTGIEPRR
jgi:hypothetical protein